MIWLRRLGFLVIILIWIFIISLPILAFVLASQQQIKLGNDPQASWRVFLIQEKNVEGLGSEWARPISTNPSCRQTNVKYFMWAGEAENVTFCQCLDAETNLMQPATAGPCSLQ